MESYKDAHFRSIIKALSWRALATLATMLIVFAFTRKVALSLGVGAVEIVAKLILYYFHERLWITIPFGKKKHPLSSLSINGSLKEEDIKLIKDQLKTLGYIKED